MKVMIVDDDTDITYSVSEMLEDRNKSIKVIQANSGLECLKQLETIDVDILLVDVMMPGMSGWDLAMSLKADKKTYNIPIIFLTCLDDPACKRMGLTFGVDFLTKPFESEHLYEVLMNACGIND